MDAFVGAILPHVSQKAREYMPLSNVYFDTGFKGAARALGVICHRFRVVFLCFCALSVLLCSKVLLALTDSTQPCTCITSNIICK